MAKDIALFSVTEDNIVAESFIFSDIGEDIIGFEIRRFDVKRYSRRTGYVCGVGVSSFGCDMSVFSLCDSTSVEEEF